MILINNKSYDELCQQVYTDFVENGFSTTPGSIAKLFADIINKNVSGFYEALSINHVQAFVTTATGDFLDAIGVLLNCTRNTSELDDDFRKRITHQCLSLPRANETSIRLAVLSVAGVEDVVLRRYSHGPGSFTVVPIVNSSNPSVMSDIEDVLNDAASYGEKITIKLPTAKLVKIVISLIYSVSTTDVEKQNIAVKVREEIIKYINSLKTEQTLIINELAERIMDVDDNIVDYSCNDFKINNQNCLYINQGARWDERFAVSPDTNAIIVT
jgi:hypothetical protein